MKKLTASATPEHLQISLLVTALALVFLTTAETTYRMLVQYPSNPNMSAFMGMLVSTFLYPAVLVAVAFLLIRRNIPFVQKAYESFVVAIVGTCLYALTNYLFIGSSVYFDVYETTWMSLGALSFWLVEAVPSLLIVLVYLVVMRRKKQW
jgi:hypothetical protein